MSNQETDIHPSESSGFVACASNGPVVDKDKATQQLSELPGFYRSIDVPGRKGPRKVVEQLKQLLFEGKIGEQAKVAQRINTIHQSLERAIEIFNACRRRET